MKRVLTLVVAAISFTAIGCNSPQTVGPDQFKQAIEWTAEYPELVEPLNEAIKDDNLDEEEYKSFSGRYNTLVNQSHMGKVRDKLAAIKAEATKNEYKELLAKTREAAKAQGLDVKETSEGIELVKQTPVPAEQINKIVSTEVPGLDADKIDAALENALNKVDIVEEED